MLWYRLSIQRQEELKRYGFTHPTEYEDFIRSLLTVTAQIVGFWGGGACFNHFPVIFIVLSTTEKLMAADIRVKLKITIFLKIGFNDFAWSGSFHVAKHKVLVIYFSKMPFWWKKEKKYITYSYYKRTSHNRIYRFRSNFDMTNNIRNQSDKTWIKRTSIVR